MAKKIEIQLNNQLYEGLMNQAQEKSMTLEDYVLMILNQDESIHEKKLLEYKQYITKELEILINKVKNPTTATNNQQKSKVLIYSYKMYKHPLPKEIEDIIQYYKKKNCFHENHFYFILDKKGMVGYLGLSPQIEELPFGEYMYIYCLQLSKSYQTVQNLKYIAGFIQAIAKKENYHSVDIATIATNLADKDLQVMDFLKFDTTQIVRGKIKPKEYEVMKCSVEKIDLKKLVSKNFTNSGRIHPVAFLYEEWKHQEDMEIFIGKIQKDNHGIEFGVVIEEIYRGQETIGRYTLLVEPNMLFDELILKEIYINTIYRIIADNKHEKVQFSIPADLYKLDEFIQRDSAKKVSWYRKIIIYN